MSFAQPAFRAITPECENMAYSLLTMNSINLIMLLIVFILLISACIYLFQKIKQAPTSTPSKESETPAPAPTPLPPTSQALHDAETVKKTKGLVVAATLITTFTIGLVLWNLMISGKVRKCLKSQA